MEKKRTGEQVKNTLTAAEVAALQSNLETMQYTHLRPREPNGGMVIVYDRVGPGQILQDGLQNAIVNAGFPVTDVSKT